MPPLRSLLIKSLTLIACLCLIIFFLDIMSSNKKVFDCDEHRSPLKIWTGLEKCLGLNKLILEPVLKPLSLLKRQNCSQKYLEKALCNYSNTKNLTFHFGISTPFWTWQLCANSLTSLI